MSVTQTLPQPAPKWDRADPIPHFGKCFLSPTEAAQHQEWERQAKHFHACPDCKAGEYRLEQCPKCKGRGYYFPFAVAEHLGVAQFFYPEGRANRG